MTPTQLRAYVAVVRHGASNRAAVELGVTEAAVSNHIGALRRELEDQLFHKTIDGLVFTPGGLRLATRSVEMLGLQEQTRAEVHAAGNGQRLLRLAVSSLFAEYSAPGLIQLFTTRAKDLRVELAVHGADRFGELLTSRCADLAIGPAVPELYRSLHAAPFVRYQLLPVVACRHRLAGRRLHPADAAAHEWLLGPSAVEKGGAADELLTSLGVPERRQLVFQSGEAALAEARTGSGIAFALAHRVAGDVREGKLATLDIPGHVAHGTWTVYATDRHGLTPAASELLRFASTPRAMQAALSGSAASVSRFRPSVHVTLWS